MTAWHRKVFTLDNLLHAIGGGAMALAIYASPILGTLVSLTVFGVLREQAQGGFPITKLSLGWHKWLEALAWGFGGASVMLALAFF